MDIKLNFINQANMSNDAAVVIFQKNVAVDFDGLIYAWKVIRHCDQGDNRPFLFSTEMTVTASDGYGCYRSTLPAEAGQLFVYQRAQQGNALAYVSEKPARYPQEVAVLNALPDGSINADIYRSDRLLAAQTFIAPQQTARFEFNPTIWIGVTSESVFDGDVMNSAKAKGIDTELSLLGVASADIVLTGGGGVPYTFSLENVIKA